MSLPASWVDRLFAKLTVTYGQGFLRQYEGIPIADVKVNWAEELASFQQSPDSIRYGLTYLPPSKAPTVLEFRDLCRKAPSSTLSLAAPRGESPAPEVIAATRDAFRSLSQRGDKDWAYALREREGHGKGLTLYQRKAWREAIGTEVET